MEYQQFLDHIIEPQNRIKLQEVIGWAKGHFPTLSLELKWNQPMLLDHGTFIIAFSVSKKHISVAPEKMILDRYTEDIKKHYSLSKMIFRINLDQEVNYQLLKNIIQDTINEKQDYHQFWL